MKTIRLVVAGTPGAGKSTFVRTISDIKVVDTESNTTDKLSQLKKKTTVAFDFGRLALPSSLHLNIYGAPGQARFNFMWDFLMENAQGYILLIAAHRPSDFPYARYIHWFTKRRVQIPMLIGLTHIDHPEARNSEEIIRELGYFDEKNRVPFIIVNPTDRTSVIKSLIALMMLIIAEDDGHKPLEAGEDNQLIEPNFKSNFNSPWPRSG
ncbi:MAG: ATP/GTP-binding protein [Coleofasciculaceae cyanobacterium]